MVNKALRIVLYSIFTISLLFVVPFNNIYASVQSEIVPTFSSSTSQWNNHLSVTNFSDGTNNQASSTLSFTFDDDYYGMIYFDGYGPSNQHIANFAVCYVAGGYGEWRYSYYQNSLINITSVTIQIVNVVKPQTTVDLTQIITLLTAIENDTSSIDHVLDTTLAQIRLVLAELIESNGYLETLTKLRQYNFPIESFSAVLMAYNYNTNIIDLFQNGYWTYPIFSIPTGNTIIERYYKPNYNNLIFIFGCNFVPNLNHIGNYFNIQNANIVSISTIKEAVGFRIAKMELSYTGDSTGYITISALRNIKIIPIYLEFTDYNMLSSDFALQYGLTNRILDDIQLIANGTNASSAASSQSEQANSQLQQDSNTLFTQEDSFKQDMNSAMQNIDTTFTLNNFGTSFMTSAMWVRQQYETLTNNTPFASLITFSLLVGLALIVVGKVYK